MPFARRGWPGSTSCSLSWLRERGWLRHWCADVPLGAFRETVQLPQHVAKLKCCVACIRVGRGLHESQSAP
jgi:hypothetical protein